MWRNDADCDELVFLHLVDVEALAAACGVVVAVAVVDDDEARPAACVCAEFEADACVLHGEARQHVFQRPCVPCVLHVPNQFDHAFSARP